MSEKYQVWTREGRREITWTEWRDFDRSLWHRTNGPAVIHPNGAQWWYQTGQIHRTDGPAVITPNGLEVWYQNGQLHRTNGPAVIHPDGTEYWYQNGQIHRTDGPAVITPNGPEYWHLNDNLLPKDEVELWIKTNGIDLNRLEDQLMFLTEWGPG